MGTKTKTSTALNEEELRKLLASLHRKPSSEADFEKRFTHVFHQKVYESAACSSSRSRLWENICMFFAGHSIVRKSAYASATASFLAVIGAFFFLLSEVPTVESLAQSSSISADAHLLALFAKLDADQILAANGKTVQSNFNIQIPPRFQGSSYTGGSITVGNQNYLLNDGDVANMSKVNHINLLPVPYSSLRTL